MGWVAFGVVVGVPALLSYAVWADRWARWTLDVRLAAARARLKRRARRVY